MEYEFRWNDWNLDKLAKHNVDFSEAEYVVNHARRPYPKIVGDRKRIVWGPTEAGEYLQVVYVLEVDGVAFVIHARPLTGNEKRRMRKRFR